MTHPAYTVSEIATVCRGEVYTDGDLDGTIDDLLIDSRSLIHPEHCLFVALVTGRNDGHNFIRELYENGVRAFLVSRLPAPAAPDLPAISPAQPADLQFRHFPQAAFILVPDTLKALQALGAFHRSKFAIPVIGVTGSNGKTIVKEWLFQMLSHDHRVVRSPKSYNSQIGVPLSVWKMGAGHDLAVFEVERNDEGFGLVDDEALDLLRARGH